MLFYFGMLAISGMHKEETKLTIPNQVVREQLFAYILDTYDHHAQVSSSIAKAVLEEVKGRVDLV